MNKFKSNPVLQNSWCNITEAFQIHCKIVELYLRRFSMFFILHKPKEIWLRRKHAFHFIIPRGNALFFCKHFLSHNFTIGSWFQETGIVQMLNYESTKKKLLFFFTFFEKHQLARAWSYKMFQVRNFYRYWARL